MIPTKLISLFAIVATVHGAVVPASNATTPTPSVTRPSPEVQPAPTSLAGLVALIRGNAAGAQFRFVDTQGYNLDVAHFITSDNAPLFSAQNSATGINTAFTFSIISAGTPLLVEIKDVNSGSFLSYGLASAPVPVGQGPPTYEHSQVTLNKNFQTVFAIASVGGTGFTIQETSSSTFLTVWPVGVFPLFSPVTYELFDGSANLFTQTWSFQPLQ